MRALNNSEVAGFAAKRAELGSEEYAERVAQAVMGAVDALPPEPRSPDFIVPGWGKPHLGHVVTPALLAGDDGG